MMDPFGTFSEIMFRDRYEAQEQRSLIGVEVNKKINLVGECNDNEGTYTWRHECCM